MFHLVMGSAYLLFLVHRSCDHVYIQWSYLWHIYIYMMMYVFFTYLYMCCFFSISIHMFLITCMQSIISVHTKMPWCVLFKVFQKYRLSKSTCHKLSSCKVFQEFLLGYILLYSTSEYELSDLWLLSYIHLFVVVLSQISKGGDY